MWMLCVAGFVISVWAAFFGGAERLEGTFLGYFEFSHFADKASYIRALSLIGIVLFAFGLVYDLAA